MKIKEILSESADWIHNFWLLHSVDIKSFLDDTQKLYQLYNVSSEKDLIKSELVRTYSYLDELLRNPKWEHLEEDPDYDKIYDGLLDVYEGIQSFLRANSK
jgi:hypothetical protein